MKSCKRTKVLLSLLSAIAFLSAIMPLPSIANAQGNDLVLYDGEAENSLDGCSSWIQKEDGSGSFSIDTTVTHDGKQSLKLSATAENIVDVNYWFGEKTVPANSTVKLSGYVKTENLTVTGAGLRVLYGTIGLEYALGVTGTNDWTAFETTVTVAEEKALSGTNMCFDMNGCVGTAWLQGVKLEIVEEPEQPENSNVLYDGEAENSLDGCSSWIQKEDGSGSFSIDTTVTHDGKQSLKLSATAENIVDVNYWFGEKTVPANSTVKLSGYVKTENLTVTGAGLRVLYGTIGLEYALGVTGTNDWTAFETTVTVAEEKALSGTNMCFDMNGCVGTAWLQGVKLEIVTAPEQPDEPEQPKDPNVLYDGEAEKSLDGCSSWMLKEDGSGSFSIDTTVTHDGKQSLKLAATAENIVDVNYWFGEKTVPAGAVIKLSGYAKTDNLTVTGAGLRVLYNAIGLTCSINLTGTNDWTAFETTVTVAEETVLTTTNLCFDIHGCVGTAWFQGVKLEIVDIVELTNVLYDAGAESADTFGNYRTWQTSNDASVSLDTTVTREGKPSIQFKATAPSIADLYIPLNVTVVKGKSIKVSGWIKTDNLETTAEGMRFLLQKKVGGNDSEAMSFGNVRGTSDWTYFEKIYTPTEDTMISQLILNMNWCTGTAWVQGVKVEMVDEEEPPEDPSDVPYLPPEDDDDDIFDTPSNIDDDINNKEENQSPGTGMSTMLPISLLAICSAAGIAALRKKQK